MENEGMEMLQQSGSAVLSLVGGLLLFALVLLAAWFCTRWLGGHYRAGSAGGGSIQVLERAAVGPDRTLMIVRVKRQVWLLGVTPQSIQPIGELDPADYPEEAPSPAAAAGRDFSAALQSAIKGWTDGKKQGQDDENS